MAPLGWENPLHDLPEWDITGGVLPSRQPCPRCGRGEYSLIATLRSHLSRWHPELSLRQRSEATAEALRRARFDARITQEVACSPRRS